MRFRDIFSANGMGQKLLALLLAGYIQLVFLTSRKRYDFHPDSAPYYSGEKNAIFAFWHGRIMLCTKAAPHGRRMRVLISHHRDGRLISNTIRYFGRETISGSSSHGALAATKEMLRALSQGDNISITPDGPRGPAQVAAKGVLRLAQLSGLPIIPITFSASRHKRLSSWDRFMLALPFSTLALCGGQPIFIARDMADEEAERQRIDDAMNALCTHADAMVGHA